MDNINEWTKQAKASEDEGASSTGGVRVVRNKPVHQSIGQIIMQVADKIRPHLSSLFEGSHNSDGMLVQPAHIRGLALEVAEWMVKEEQKNRKSA